MNMKQEAAVMDELRNKVLITRSDDTLTVAEMRALFAVFAEQNERLQSRATWRTRTDLFGFVLVQLVTTFLIVCAVHFAWPAPFFVAMALAAMGNAGMTTYSILKTQRFMTKMWNVDVVNLMEMTLHNKTILERIRSDQDRFSAEVATQKQPPSVQ